MRFLKCFIEKNPQKGGTISGILIKELKHNQNSFLFSDSSTFAYEIE